MSTTTAPATPADFSGLQAAPSGLGWVVKDILVITGRNLLKIRRSPQLLVFSTIQPVMFVLLFNYVFGGALDIAGFQGDYINFLLPGIFVQTAMFGSTQSGIALNEDLRAGIVDRFRSLPMARSAVLAGRTIADAVRTLFTTLLMVAVGYALGFRFSAGVLPAIGAVLLGVFMAFAFSWVSANIGMRAPDAETAQAGGFIWVFPLVFASSAFVSTESMPGWLRAFADNSPVTAVVNAIRVLVNGGPTAADTWTALAWIVGILVVAVPLAIAGYRKTA
ncbi:ABC transporter permease [Euzebya tangerina]|uniref:ABC transporter permease n=1 Tax=Euzebya tangerina TaxID=591198 RepID=UPI000E310F35|nr:ABC transporter permease [Euzebya tangerina]